MWKPDKPIVIAGSELSAQEAWMHEFAGEFYELCSGEVDLVWLLGLASTLYLLNLDRAPREAAVVAFTPPGYDLPEDELEEPFTPPAPRRRPGPQEQFGRRHLQHRPRLLHRTDKPAIEVVRIERDHRALVLPLEWQRLLGLRVNLGLVHAAHQRVTPTLAWPLRLRFIVFGALT